MKKIFLLFLLALFPFSALANHHLTIYIWDSGMSGGEHYGHVSLKTFRHYISLWPASPDTNSQPEHNGTLTVWRAPDIDRVDLDNVGCIKAKAINNEDYYADKLAEGSNGRERAADAIYHLKVSLDQEEAIEREWERLQSQRLVWFALGTSLTGQEIQIQLQSNNSLRNSLVDLYHNPLAFNCASVVHHLLKKGNLDLSRYVGIDSKHSPLMQGLLFTAITKMPHKSIETNTYMFDKLMYPDKIGYMTKQKMIDTIKREFDYNVFALDDEMIDHIYNLVRSETYYGYTLRLDENKEIIRSYLKAKWDASFPGQIYNNCTIS